MGTANRKMFTDQSTSEWLFFSNFSIYSLLCPYAFTHTIRLSLCPPRHREHQENRMLPPCAGLHSRMKVKACMEMNSKKGSGFWEALQAQHSSPLETRESLHCHCYPASQRQSLQFAKKLLLGRRKRKREEGKILGLSKPMLLIVPKISLHYMHILYTVPNQSILLVIWQRRKEENSFLFERRQCREVQHSHSGCYFICPWATLAAASTQVSCKYCLTGSLGPASWHIPREEKRQIKRIHDRNAKTNTSQVRIYLRSERFPHLSLLSAVGINTGQKQLWGGRGLFSSQATVYHLGKPGKEP